MIAIIALLAALLLPALKKARDKAQTVVCANNLRQMGVAAFGYTDDSDGYLPYHRNFPNQLRPYVANSQWFCAAVGSWDARKITRNLAMCPIYDNRVIEKWFGGPIPSFWGGTAWRCEAWTYRDYGMNENLQRSRYDPVSATTIFWGEKITRLQYSSSCLLLVESSFQITQGWRMLYYNPRHGGVAVSAETAAAGATYVTMMEAPWTTPLGIGLGAASLRTDGHYEPLLFNSANLVWEPLPQTPLNKETWYGM